MARRRTVTNAIIRPRKPTCADAKPEINQNDRNQPQSDDSRAPLLVIDAFDVAAFTDFVHAPDVQDETVEEGEGGEDGESPR